MGMNMTLRFDAATEDERTIPAGEVVKYLGHVPGGMVRVEWHGERYVIHPATTVELSGKRN